LYDLYPLWVRNWIVQRGGLSSRMLILEGAELRSHVLPCRYAAVPARAESRNRYGRKTQ
jgi:hypothetical protein